jgi:hypothetical protein
MVMAKLLENFILNSIGKKIKKKYMYLLSVYLLCKLHLDNLMMRGRAKATKN